MAAKGHEFWIDPEVFTPEVGGPIVADLRVGQEFRGSGMSYLPPEFRRFDYLLGDRIEAVPGRIGDRPAVQMDAPDDGLMVLVHETTDKIVTYREMEKFGNFVRHKDAEWVLDVHRAKGFPVDTFREVYSRYAKSLVGIGDGQGDDRAFGLLTEIVALENPYTGDMSDGIDVAVLYQGAPRADAQVEIFERAPDGLVEITTVKTDGNGRATVPVRTGYAYMLDAVVLREPDPALAQDRNAIWESLWANLTFAVPE